MRARILTYGCAMTRWLSCIATRVASSSQLHSPLSRSVHSWSPRPAQTTFVCSFHFPRHSTDCPCHCSARIRERVRQVHVRNIPYPVQDAPPANGWRRIQRSRDSLTSNGAHQRCPRVHSTWFRSVQTCACASLPMSLARFTPRMI